MPEDTGQPAEGTPTEAAPESSTPEWAPVLDRVGELAGNVGELQQGFQQFLQSQQPEPEPEPDPWAALMGEDDQSTYEEQQPQGLDVNQLREALRAEMAQTQQPLMERLAEFEYRQAEQQFIQRYPQLADKPENAETRQRLGNALSEALAGASPETVAWARNNVNFIETVFKAAEAEKLAAGQAPASEQPPSLEAAGGAVPGGNGEQPNQIKSVMEGQWQLPPGLR